jgi:hypothetical protein
MKPLLSSKFSSFMIFLEGQLLSIKVYEVIKDIVALFSAGRSLIREYVFLYTYSERY